MSLLNAGLRAFRGSSSGPAPRPRTSAGGGLTSLVAIGACIGIAVAGALLWGLVAMLFRTQLPLIGLVIGGGVGLAVARFRGAHWPTVAAGAVIAVAGCALGTLLAIVFVLLHSGISLSFVLGHIAGPMGVLHYYPSSVGVLGLVFWAGAAFLAIRIPLRRR